MGVIGTQHHRCVDHLCSHQCLKIGNRFGAMQIAHDNDRTG